MFFRIDRRYERRRESKTTWTCLSLVRYFSLRDANNFESNGWQYLENLLQLNIVWSREDSIAGQTAGKEDLQKVFHKIREFNVLEFFLTISAGLF